MRPPDNLNLTTDEFVEYLRNECKEYVRSQVLRIDEHKHAHLDDSIRSERVFFHTSCKNRLAPLIDRLARKYGVAVEIRNHDRYTECVHITGRVVAIEDVKSALKENLGS